MNIGARLRHLLAFLLVVAVSAIPLAANASLSGAGMPAAMASLTSMADGMPCCPDDAPAMPDCLKACPLLAACMTKCAPAAPALLVTFAHQVVTLAAARPRDDLASAEPVSGPPSRPPRS